jgi:hypothetical protein
MKALLLTLGLVFSLNSLTATHELAFHRYDVKIDKVILNKPMPVNMIKLYRKIDFEKRMIAGFKASKQETPAKLSWLDSLRTKLQNTNGKIRL